MKTLFSNAAQWLPTVANLAVLGGLILVIYQLQQNAELARISQIQARNEMESELWYELMDAETTRVIARSELCPEQLVLAEYIILDSYLYAATSNLFNNYEMAKEGLFAEDDWKREVDNYAYWYLGGTFGKTYWDNIGRKYFSSEFTDYVDKQIARGGMDASDAWEVIRSKLSPTGSIDEWSAAGCRGTDETKEASLPPAAAGS